MKNLLKSVIALFMSLFLLTFSSCSKDDEYAYLDALAGDYPVKITVYHNYPFSYSEEVKISLHVTREGDHLKAAGLIDIPAQYGGPVNLNLTFNSFKTTIPEQGIGYGAAFYLFRIPEQTISVKGGESMTIKGNAYFDDVLGEDYDGEIANISVGMNMKTLSFEIANADGTFVIAVVPNIF